MSREQLEHALKRLRSELDDLDQGPGEANAELHALITEVEGQLDSLELGNDDTSVADKVKNYIEQFEIEHPRVTNILNEIMVTLSNMGI
jgi:chromosome segregation ATPase